MELIIPSPGDIWQDANGNHNLILASRNDESEFITLCLETGKFWHEETIVDWNDPEWCTANDGKPFYRMLIV